MPDQNITAVRVTESTKTERREAKAVLSVGDSIYWDDTDQGKADLTDSSTEAKARCRGICVTAAIVGGQVEIATGGNLVLIGASLSPKNCLVVSNTAGKLKLESDLGANEFVTQVARPVTTEEANILILPMGVST